MDDRLQAYEQRAKQIAALWSTGASTCISIGLNLPGGSQAYRFATDLQAAALQAVATTLADHNLILRVFSQATDQAGPFSLAATEPAVAAPDLKLLLVQIEQQHPLGRLFDLDLLLAGQGPLSRAELGLPPRLCLVCPDAAHVCRRLGRHDANELQSAVQQLVSRYDPATFARLAVTGQAVNLLAADIGAKVTAGMLLEVACWPSPGLVSPFDNGGHTDMAWPTFLVSSSTLAPGFSILAGLGSAASNSEPSELMPKLRTAGYLFEQRMLHATGNVNTHRGYLFLGGLVAAAAGYLAAAQGLTRLRAGDLSAAEIAAAVAGFTSGIVQGELQTGSGSVRALGLYRSSGLTGPRGEAEAGLPAVLELGLPALQLALSRSVSLNDALVHTLITLIANVGDTALAGRHQATTLAELVWPAAQSALTAGSVFTTPGRTKILELHYEFARLRINPGGSADLMALTAAIYLLEADHWPAEAMLAKSLFVRSDSSDNGQKE